LRLSRAKSCRLSAALTTGATERDARTAKDTEKDELNVTPLGGSGPINDPSPLAHATQASLLAPLPGASAVAAQGASRRPSSRTALPPLPVREDGRSQARLS